MKFRRGSSSLETDPSGESTDQDANLDAPWAAGIGKEEKEDAPNSSVHVSLFGARSQARSLATQLAELQEHVNRLGLLSSIELEKRREEFTTEISELEQRLAQERRDAIANAEKEAAVARERAEQSVSALLSQKQQLVS